MSWLSNWLDRQGGVGKSINAVGGPLVNVAGKVGKEIPGVGTVIRAGEALGGYIPGGGGGTPATGVQAGAGGLSMADLLKTGGAIAGGAMDYAQSEAARKQRADEFTKTMAQRTAEFGKDYGLRSNTQQVGLQSLLNRAPLADKAQFGAMNVQAPSAFQPRDYTRGLNQLQGQATGGPQAQLQANQAASAKYTPGSGGVNTDTLKMILARLQGGG